MTRGPSSLRSPEEPQPWAAEVGGRYFFVPIIHHFPWSHRCVLEAVEALNPDCIAVQLPVDASQHLDALARVDQFPVALYGFAVGDVHSRVYAPLSVTSPEVAALRSGVPISVIDVPMEHAADVPKVAKSLGASLKTRCLGESAARLFGGLSITHLHEMFAENRACTPREQFMAHRLRTLEGERILVVLGAAHSAAVVAALASPFDSTALPGAPLSRSTWETWCVPYDEGRLHEHGGSLFPRWQRLAFECPGRAEEHLAEILAAIGQRSRSELHEGCSVVDEIEALGAARLLSRFRRLPEPGVYELLDGIRLAMVSDRGGTVEDFRDLSSSGPFGPLGPFIREEVVGTKRGVVPEGAGHVPLWADAQQRLAKADLRRKHLRLDVLRSPKDRARSQLLHQLTWLEVPGIENTRDARDEQGDIAWLFEKWRVDLGPQSEQCLIDSAPRGPTVAEACTDVLEERLGQHTLGVLEATWLLERCLQMGLGEAAQRVLERIQNELALRAPFVELGGAVANVILLTQTPAEPQLDTHLQALADNLADRAASALSRVAKDPADSDRFRWLDALQSVFLHACSTSPHTGWSRSEALSSAMASAAQRGPFLRGACSALRAALGTLSTEDLGDVVQAECSASRVDPTRFSAFITGVLLASSGLLTRSPALLAAVDVALQRWSEDVFVHQLPDLRLAFSALTVLDTRRLVTLLGGGTARRSPAEGSAVADATLRERLNALGIASPTLQPTQGVAESQALPTYRALERWRMVLGDYRHPWPEDVALPGVGETQNGLLDQLYGQPRRSAGETLGQEPEPGGGARSASAALSWLARCREAFQDETVQRLQEHALHHFGMQEVLLDPQVISQLQPSLGIAKALVQLRDHIPPESLEYVRRLIRRVAEDIRKHFEQRMRPSLRGATRTRERSPLRIARNLDLARTVRDNLKHTDPDTGQLGIETIAFTSRVRRKNTWRILLLVDQSGSMVEAAIDAAVLGGIFASVSALETHLIAFDSEPRDLSPWVHDTAEVLLRRTPAGGTHISRALRYAETLVTTPSRTLCVVVTDLFEGGPVPDLIAAFSRMKSAGVRSLVLTGVGTQTQPYDPLVARQLEELDIPTKALAPEDLGQWIARAMR